MDRAPGSARGRGYHELMVDPALVSQARQLSPADRLALIGTLWESLSPDDLPVTEAQKAFIDERLTETATDPLAGRAWEDVEAELRQRLP